MKKTKFKTSSPLYDYWKSDQRDIDNKTRVKKANISIKPYDEISNELYLNKVGYIIFPILIYINSALKIP